MLINYITYIADPDDIYDSNKQHQPESWIETEKYRHGKNEHELLVPKPKTNLKLLIPPFTTIYNYWNCKMASGYGYWLSLE